jgi:hypothetical protein
MSNSARDTLAGTEPPFSDEELAALAEAAGEEGESPS